MKRAAERFQNLNQPRVQSKSPLKCRAILNKFYEDLKERHQREIGCAYVLNESQSIRETLKQQLKQIL
jgi:hypothetical protein